MEKTNITGNAGDMSKTVVRYTKSGRPVTNFSIANHRGKGEEQTTTWRRVVCFGRLAEVAAKGIQKGYYLTAEGRLQTRKWVDKEGEEHTEKELLADSITIHNDRAPKTDEKAPEEAPEAKAPEAEENLDI